MSETLFRRCPNCGVQNPIAILRCACGTLLAGVDVSAQSSTLVATPPSVEIGVVCAHEDCGQSNLAGSQECVYCGRPLMQATGLLVLPSALKSQYRIIKPLDSCGAEADLLLVAPVAGGLQRVVKIYRHGISPNPAVLACVKKVSIEHRIELLAAGVSDGHAYELMEYCSLGSLRTMLNQRMPLSLLRSLIHELLIALTAFHQAGLIHRDLKPENILIRQTQPLDLVLTDFGISVLSSQQDNQESVAQTLPYAPPESLSGLVSCKADYWALGMIVLEAACGRHPYTGLSEAVILHHLLTCAIDLSAVTDDSVRILLEGLLQRDPAQRWGAEELRRWLDNDPALQRCAQSSVVADTASQSVTLGTNLVEHWHEGLADLRSGRLMQYLRDEFKNQNAVRMLLRLQNQPELSAEVRLLKLILYLAPNIPPVWQGETLTLSLIRQQAKANNCAWLDSLYQQSVLTIYHDAGNRQLGELGLQWHQAITQYFNDRNMLWQSLNERYQVAIPPVPSEASLHPALLVLLLDGHAEATLRQELRQFVYPASCNWLAQRYPVASLSIGGLLLLQQQREEACRVIEQYQQQVHALCEAIQQAVDKIQHAHYRMLFAANNALVGLQNLTHDLQHLLQQARSLKDPCDEWQQQRSYWLQLDNFQRSVQHDVSVLYVHRQHVLYLVSPGKVLLCSLAAIVMFLFVPVFGLILGELRFKVLVTLLILAIASYATYLLIVELYLSRRLAQALKQRIRNE